MPTELLNINGSLNENYIQLGNHWMAGLSSKKTVVNHPILPKEGCKNFLITSALPYVNNVPHLGNIIGCVLSADCFARYSRLRGYQTLFICGTDEYGTTTETKALEEGVTCEELCEKYRKLHQKIYSWFNISFDYFGQTTTSKQTEIAQDIFFKLKNNNYLIEDTLEQLYCEKCQRFLADRFVEGICVFCQSPGARGDQCDFCGKLINAIELKSPKCKICSSTPSIKKSKHLFLDLPQLESELSDKISDIQEKGIWSPNAVAITKAWLKEGLKQRCITRDMRWGTPVPLNEYKDKVFYVWFDAPIGYISITANYTDQWEKWWKNPSVRLVNFMAKDNIPFHTVVFPSTLIGARDNYIIATDISSTEYLKYQDQKFSKSRGIGVFGDNASESGIKSDIFRLYLLSNRPESQDTSFCWEDLINRNNNIFINNIGNFINRSLSLLFKKFDGEIKDIKLTKVEIELILKVNDFISKYIECMNLYRIREAFNNLCEISHVGNQYIQHTVPWELDKNNKEQEIRLSTILSFSANIATLIGLLMDPFAPEVSSKIRDDLGLEECYWLITNEFVRLLDTGKFIKKPSIYFTKINSSQAKILSEKYRGKTNDCRQNSNS